MREVQNEIESPEPKQLKETKGKEKKEENKNG
jgi:hypothetical protein